MGDGAVELDADASTGSPTKALGPPPAQRAVSGTLYAPGTFPRSQPAAPPIYRVPGGGRRSQEWIDVDIRLRAAASSNELLQIIGDDLHRFDTGNVVIAFTCAAKLDDGHDMSTLEPSPAWSALQERLIFCAEGLEPRGMSMSAYAAAKLMWGDEPLLVGLAHAGSRRAAGFGATDIAKSCWAFAKLRFVAEPAAEAFWRVIAREAERTLRTARFVDISMISWAFGLTGYGDQAFFSEISFATRAVCDTLPPRSLAGIAYACARAKYAEPRLFAAIGKRARDTVDDFGGHDAAALCWAFAAAGVADVPLYEALATKLVASGAARRLSPPLAAELAWGFAAARVHDTGLFAELEELCKSHIQDLETEDVAGFAWSFAAMGRRDPVVFAAISAYSERFAGRLRPGELRMLSWALASAHVGAGERFLAAVGAAASGPGPSPPQLCI